MVRCPALMLVSSVLIASLVGCSEPVPDAGSDVAPISVGDCLAEGIAKPVDCKDNHVAQTVYVSDSPPGGTSAALSPCREAQATFLGEDFNTRLDVQLWVPEDESWYRCDVLLRNSTRGNAGYQVLTGSLRNVLRKGVSVKLQACLDEQYDVGTDQVYVACSEPHVSQELVIAPAIGTNDEPFPADVSQRATQACNATAAAADQLVEGRHIEAFYPENANAWSTGERSADCWVTTSRGRLPGAEPTG